MHWNGIALASVILVGVLFEYSHILAALQLAGAEEVMVGLMDSLQAWEIAREDQRRGCNADWLQLKVVMACLVLHLVVDKETKIISCNFYLRNNVITTLHNIT